MRGTKPESLLAMPLYTTLIEHIDLALVVIVTDEFDPLTTGDVTAWIATPSGAFAAGCAGLGGAPVPKLAGSVVRLGLAVAPSLNRTYTTPPLTNKTSNVSTPKTVLRIVLPGREFTKIPFKVFLIIIDSM